MSVFVCQECGSLDNTALTRFWMRGEGKALCSACDLDGPHDGNWHGLFPRVKYDPDQHQPSWIDGEWQEVEPANPDRGRG